MFDDFEKKEGRKISKVLLTYKKNKEFVEALSTNVGQQMLLDLLEMFESKVEKVILGTATERDKEGIIICRFLTARWIDRLNEFNKVKNEIS